jgi:hypothetical protein
MTLATERNTGHFHYGGIDYWVLRKNVGGASARRLSELVELHFHESGSPLVLDLRQVPVIDSEGAYYLESARQRHAGLQVVGKPRDYATLPASIRETLDVIRPSESLESALSLRSRSALRRNWPHKRRHNRIPLTIPVEIFSDGRSAVATLRDISLGGVRLGRFSSPLVREREGSSAFPQLTIAGIGQDPLGREVIKSFNTSEIVTRPVYVLPGNGGMGVQFTPSPGRSEHPSSA